MATLLAAAGLVLAPAMPAYELDPALALRGLPVDHVELGEDRVELSRLWLDSGVI